MKLYINMYSVEKKYLKDRFIYSNIQDVCTGRDYHVIGSYFHKKIWKIKLCKILLKAKIIVPTHNI